MTRIRLGWRQFVILTAAVLAVSFASPLYSQDSNQGSLTEQDVYRSYGYIPMRDGVKLAYVVYMPKKDGRYPTVVEYSPYASDGLQFKAVQPYLEHGYAYVGANVRGSSCSQGTFSLYQSAENEDGGELIDWVGTQSWSTGSVGMVGNSYPGHTQFSTASVHPKHLKALAAGGLTNSSYSEGWRLEGMFDASMASNWGFHGQDASAGRAAEARMKWGDTECKAIRTDQPANRTFYDVLEHPLNDDWWKERAMEKIVGDVNVPTMIVQGWQDHYTQSFGGQHLYRALTVPKKMILQSGGHHVYLRDIVQEQVIRWMDHWLKGENNGIDKEPRVTILWEVRDQHGKATPNWTTNYSDWPPPEAKSVSFYLTSDSKLSREKQVSGNDSGKLTYTYPFGTELVGDNVQFAVPPNSGGILTYRTLPMTEDMAILGLPMLTFYVSSEQKDTDFMVVLHDVDQQGNTLFLQRSFLRASLRAIDPTRSTPDEIYRPYDKVEEIVPHQIYEMKISFPPVGHVVRQGHILELAIMAPSPIPAPNWGPVPLDLPGRNTVYSSAQYPSNLVLPVIPGMKAQAPPPVCGSLEFQPCRAPRRATAAESAE